MHGGHWLDHREHVHLASGVTTTVFESTPVYPTPARYWQTVDKHKITQFYSAPTAIRLLCRLGEHDLGSCAGQCWQTINPEAWHWYNDDYCIVSLSTSIYFRGSINIEIELLYITIKQAGIKYCYKK